MSGPAVVLDVNETLLDMGALAEPFRLALGAAEARTEWFERLLRMAMAATLGGEYHDFAALRRAPLAQIAAEGGFSPGGPDQPGAGGSRREPAWRGGFPRAV